MKRVERVLAAAALAAALGFEPATAGPGDDGWAHIGPELDVALPRDHGSHPSFKTEWWYVTGEVEDEAGRSFGFQFTVFRQGLSPDPPAGDSLRASQLFAGHLVVTDVAGGRTLFAERARRDGTPLAAASTADLDLALEDWTLARTDGDRLRLAAADPGLGIALDLELVPEKPLVRHGRDGVSVKGREPGNASAYLSWTRLAVNGELAVDGTPRTITGAAWFDHEWGTTQLGAGIVGWDWFSLHLADGRDLMLYGLRREDGSFDAVSGGTLVEADGAARRLVRRDFEIDSTRAWESPRSGAVYPAGWILRVPGEGLELTVQPLVADCELATERSTGVTYWEGPIAVSGSATGRGYAELTGYADTLEGRF